MTAAADTELLERWRGGEVGAGTELFERYYEPVLRFFKNKVGTGIADLVQETFKACVEGRDRLRSDASFRSYLFSVAHNVLRGHLRRRYRRDEELDLDATSVASLEPGPSSMLAEKREQRLLLEGLRNIPINYQVILELRYWEEMKTREMAEVLGIPEPTARGQLRRAHELLEAAIMRLGQHANELKSTLSKLDDWAESCRHLAPEARPAT